MSKLAHGFGHAVILALGFVAQFGGFVPGKYRPLALAVQGVAHAILALVNHDPVQS